MGISRVLLKNGFELAIDQDNEEEKLFSLTMGTGFTTGKENSVNIEMRNLNLCDIKDFFYNLRDFVESHSLE